MIETTAKNAANALIKSLLQEGYTDEMTGKWPSLTPNPPRIPVFYTLIKIHKPKPVGRSIISGWTALQNDFHRLVDRLIQPIAQIQESDRPVNTYAWLCRLMCGYVWMCRVIYGYV